MNHIEIYDSARKKNIYSKQWPSKWEELTRTQFINVVQTLFENEDKDSARAKLTYVFLKRPLISLKLTYGEAFELGDTLRFLYGENPISLKSFLPKIRPVIFIFTGPSDNFVNLTAWQFACAEMAFEKAIKTPSDLNCLAALGACLYRPFWRKKFDDSILPGLNRSLLKLKPNQLHAIFFNYMMMRGALARQYPNVFNGGDKKSKHKFGWIAIIQKLPGDVFGTLDKRSDEPLHNVLMHLEMTAIEAAELERKTKKK